MHKPESIQENDAHKIHWDFESPNHNQKTRPFMLIKKTNKRIWHLVDFGKIKQNVKR